ncbi:hypothetical protein AB0B45_30210 [Nonomuraea sp. NPDC049152]|uniref:DUF6924 domain-containing protein n=1 Tax=Nonomuraea sp. NPDC049152 TaxID=3154350 RepID=UPI0033FE9D8F
MDVLPEAQAMLVLRTDFSRQDAWEAVRAAIGVSGTGGFVEEYMDEVRVLEDAAYQDLAPQDILALVPDGYENSILVVVDETTTASAELPLLVIDLVEEHGRTMRVIPAELPSIQANLSIANMDFSEFADNVDDDGVFRGFPD